MEAQNLQQFKALIMPQVEKMIQLSINNLKNELLANDKATKQYQSEIQSYIDQKIAKDQVESIQKDIIGHSNRLQAIQICLKQVQYIKKEDIKRVEKNIQAIQKQIKQINQSFAMYTQEYMMLAHKNVERLKGNQEDWGQKFQDIREKIQQMQNKIKSLGDKQQKFEKNAPFGEMKEFRKEQQQFEVSAPYENVNPKSKCIGQFIINGKEIIKKNNGEHQLLGSVPISIKNVNTFTINITSDGFILIGIIDPGWINDENSSKRKQRICYAGYGSVWESGYCYQEGLAQIKIGSKVVMSVDGKTVTWTVDNQTFSHSTHQIIQQWVPFILMYNNGESTRWE